MDLKNISIEKNCPLSYNYFLNSVFLLKRMWSTSLRDLALTAVGGRWCSRRGADRHGALNGALNLFDARYRTSRRAGRRVVSEALGGSAQVSNNVQENNV